MTGSLKRVEESFKSQGEQGGAGSGTGSRNEGRERPQAAKKALARKNLDRRAAELPEVEAWLEGWVG